MYIHDLNDRSNSLVKRSLVVVELKLFFRSFNSEKIISSDVTVIGTIRMILKLIAIIE